jgi:hypothetical protein
LAAELDSGSCVVDLGAKCDALCTKAGAAYASEAPAAKDAAGEKARAGRAAELEQALEAPLRVLQLRQVALLRDKALKRYKAAAKDSEGGDFEAMVAADAFFGEEATTSMRGKDSGGGPKAKAERDSLQATMTEMARAKKRLADTKLAAAKTQQEAMKILQHQNGHIAQLQQIAYGQASPLSVGLAYRVPDTNINLSVGHQQGRTNVQLSCVPDEAAPMLGPNGFTRGVGPGNLGVSLNLNV